MIKILEVLPGNRAIVSTRGLRRLVDADTGRTVEELVSIRDVKMALEFDAACQKDGKPRMRTAAYPDLRDA